MSVEQQFSPSSVSPVPQRSQGFSLHGVGGQAWLLDERGQRLFQLSDNAALIWSGYLEGQSRTAIVRSLALRCGLTRGVADERVKSALAPLSVRAAHRNLGARLSDHARPERPSDWPRPASRRRTYRLLDLRFRLLYATNRLLQRVDPLFKAASIAEPPEPGREFAVLETDEGFAIRSPDRVLSTCSGLEEVAPMVKSALAVAALEESWDAYAVHAAALQQRGRCILMPGRSGAGKSTLAAALNARGWDLIADDSAVVTRSTLRVRQLPLPLCLKEGAWALLAHRFPALADAPCHLRADGMVVRYLLPQHAVGSGLSTDAAAIHRIIFPCYAPDSGTELIRLAPADALKRLVAQLCPLGAGLDKTTLETLIVGIDQIPCFELRSGDLDRAADLVEGACR